ncbi:MAG: SpaA isopeptide-forming pilin-related protein [Lagierella massiliensis]|nr:SpaA isopeptide-forming pilin-related protein [Lagierella massiliensis]
MKNSIKKLINLILVISFLFTNFSVAFAISGEVSIINDEKPPTVEENQSIIEESQSVAEENQSIIEGNQAKIEQELDTSEETIENKEEPEKNEEKKESSEDKVENNDIQEKIVFSEEDMALIQKYKDILAQHNNQDYLSEATTDEIISKLNIEYEDENAFHPSISITNLGEKGYIKVDITSHINPVRSMRMSLNPKAELVESFYSDMQISRIETIIDSLEKDIYSNLENGENIPALSEISKAMLEELRLFKPYYSLRNKNISVLNINNNISIANTLDEVIDTYLILKVNDESVMGEELFTIDLNSEMSSYNVRVTGEDLFEDESLEDFNERESLFQPSLFDENASMRAFRQSRLSLATSGANDWQIVDKKYVGNSQNNKTGFKNTTFENYNSLWIQKNVVPTDVENEFKIYLSISKRAGWDELLKEAEFKVTTSRRYHYPKYSVGDIVLRIIGNDGTVEADPANGGNSYQTTVTFSRGGRTIATRRLIYYGTVPNCNNATGFISINGINFIASQSVNLQGNGLSFDINLDALENAGIHFLVPPVQLSHVDDLLGDYLIYKGEEYVDGTVTYTEGNHSLRWNIGENPAVKVVTVSSGGGLTGYYYNVAQLVYKVKLDVEKDGFNSCADNMHSRVGDPESYFTNKSATLRYSRAWAGDPLGTLYQAEFQKPAVRGLLYDIKIKKVDENGQVLVGEKRAKFKITNAKTENFIVEGEVDDNGLVEVRDLPWGDYKIEETSGPFKFPYKYETGSQTITLCYTTDKQDLVQSDKPENKIYADKQGYAIKNLPLVGKVKISKTVETNLTGQEKRNLENTDFTINLTLKQKDHTDVERPVSGTFNSSKGTITFDGNGKVSFIIKHGQEVTIDKLPVGATLSVEEGETDLPFIVEYSSDNLTVEKDQEASMTITNKYFVYDFSILKVDEETKASLKGATFTIYKSNENGDKLDEVVSQTTGQDGLVTFNDLAPGIYIIEETKTPDGFIAKVSKWTLTVDGTGQGMIKDENDNVLAKEIVEGVDRFTIENTPGTELPTTGGRGVTVIKIVGALIFVVALFFLIRKKKEK